MTIKPSRSWLNWVFIATLAVLTGWIITEAEETPVQKEAPATQTAPTVTEKPTPAAVETIAKPEYVGAEACLACHEKQKDVHSNAHAQFFMKKKNIPFEKSCETCHGPGSLHAEAAGDQTNPGFATIKQFAKLTNKDVSATCLQCHQDTQRMHWTGGVHESKGLSCITCHKVHEPKSRQSLLAQATGPEVCFTCHRDVKGQMRRSAHMPLVDGKMSCNDCHNPHDSGMPKQLLDNQVTNLCYRCHSDKRGPFLWEHAPVRESCLNCHHPHGSHHDKMLVETSPLLCQRCHNASRHPSTLYDNASVNTSNNRILAHGCVNCHSNIHGSNHPSGKYLFR
jgi:DmsE family decaheme c-type cytochrome